MKDANKPIEQYLTVVLYNSGGMGTVVYHVSLQFTLATKLFEDMTQCALTRQFYNKVDFLKFAQEVIDDLKDHYKFNVEYDYIFNSKKQHIYQEFSVEYDKNFKLADPDDFPVKYTKFENNRFSYTYNRKTDLEKKEVMDAFNDGKEIEEWCHLEPYNGWQSSKIPNWDWERYDFRIK